MRVSEKAGKKSGKHHDPGRKLLRERFSNPSLTGQHNEPFSATEAVFWGDFLDPNENTFACHSFQAVNPDIVTSEAEVSR